MDEESRKRLEYEEQFFGMSSKFFADSFKNFVKEEIESKISMLVESISSKILSQSKSPEKFELGLKVMKESLISEYQKSLDKSFPELESKISNFIHIPQNVLLEEDLPVRSGVDKDVNKIKEDIENMKGTFKSLLYLKQELLEELEKADSAIFLMEYVTSEEKTDFEVLPVGDIAALSKANYLLATDDS